MTAPDITRREARRRARPRPRWSRTACGWAWGRARRWPSCVPALGRRRLSITCVATSPATAELAVAHGLDVRPFSDIDRLDLAIDGADQVDPAGWLVKGGGGAHTRERIVAAAADRFVVIVSSDKPVDRLHPPVPLELLAFGLAATLHALPGAALPGRSAAPPTAASWPTTTATSPIRRCWPSGSTPCRASSRTACSRRRWSPPSSSPGATRSRCVRSSEPSGWAPGAPPGEVLRSVWWNAPSRRALRSRVLVVRPFVVRRDGDGHGEGDRVEGVVEERVGDDAEVRVPAAPRPRRWSRRRRVPPAIATWPRGMARVNTMPPVAGSHSQYPVWSWNASTSPGLVMRVR